MHVVDTIAMAVSFLCNNGTVSIYSYSIMLERSRSKNITASLQPSDVGFNCLLLVAFQMIKIRRLQLTVRLIVQRSNHKVYP
jgi:hypothetical protein